MYQSFPLGTIKPGGWFKQQLELEADGLAGHLFDFYRFVHDSMWIGGSTEYSNLHESSPYWFNGLVPLAFSLDDSRLKSQVYYFMDYVLDHQQDDGWLGPETTPETRSLWARCYFLLGLMVCLIRERLITSSTEHIKNCSANSRSNMLKPILRRRIELWTPCIDTSSSSTAC